jgi:hypothetical protein
MLNFGYFKVNKLLAHRNKNMNEVILNYKKYAFILLFYHLNFYEITAIYADHINSR